MNFLRVIPFLLLANDGLVKTINYKSRTYIGDPINAVKVFNKKEVDELALIDIDASRNNRGPDFNKISQIVSEAFMPISYTGGVSSLKDFETLFKIGVEKVGVNTLFYENRAIVEEAIKIFGAQSICICLDLKKNFFNEHYACSKYGSKKIKSSIKDLLKNIEDMGPGEVIVNAIYNDGRMKGYDLEIIRKVSSSLSAPVIALGGAGDLNHLQQALYHGANALGAGSMFVFQGPHRGVLISYLKKSDIEALNAVYVQI